MIALEALKVSDVDIELVRELAKTAGANLVAHPASVPTRFEQSWNATPRRVFFGTNHAIGL